MKEKVLATVPLVWGWVMRVVDMMLVGRAVLWVVLVLVVLWVVLRVVLRVIVSTVISSASFHRPHQC